MKPTNKQTNQHTMWLIKRLFPQPCTRFTLLYSKTPGLYEGEEKKILQDETKDTAPLLAVFGMRLIKAQG